MTTQRTKNIWGSVLRGEYPVVEYPGDEYWDEYPGGLNAWGENTGEWILKE